MSINRLEEIEKRLDPLGYGMGGHLISVNDIYWLVGHAKEQTERVQELEEQNKRYREAIEAVIKLWKNATESTDDRQLTYLMYEQALNALNERKLWNEGSSFCESRYYECIS